MLLAESARVIFALIAVLGFIGLAAMLVRKAGLISASSGLIRKKRLALVETLAIDARRRVAIIKCDGAEHLVLLGATSETLIDKDLDGPGEDAMTLATEASASPENPFLTLQGIAQKLRSATKNAA